PGTGRVRCGRGGRCRLCGRSVTVLVPWAGTRRVGARRVRNGLALVADDGDRLADRDLARLDGDLQQHAARLRLDLLRRLVGVDLEEWLALLDPVTLRLQPLRDRARLHPLPEARQLHLTAHGPPSSAPRPARPLPAGSRTAPSPARTRAARTSPPRARSARRASRTPVPAGRRRPRRRSPSASPPRARRRPGASSSPTSPGRPRPKAAACGGRPSRP